MGTTSIEWTDETWNPVRGCSRVSPGCEHRYAERQAARFSGPGQPYEGLVRLGKQGPRWNGEVRLVREHLSDPLRWRTPRRVFVNSMSDLFHERLDDHEIAAVFGAMQWTQRHTFQVLTKRATRMREWFEWVSAISGAALQSNEHRRAFGRSEGHFVGHAYTDAQPQSEMFTLMRQPPTEPPKCGVPWVWPLANVWLGVSVEDQARAIERLPDLVRTPAAIRFVSYEPALGPFDIGADLESTSNRFGLFTCPHCDGFGERLVSLVPDVNGAERFKACAHCRGDGCAIDWVIVGGESGPGARMFNIEWARDVVRQCKAIGVAVFVKQLGAQPIKRYRDEADYQLLLRFKKRKGNDMAEWPEDLRVRELPAGAP